MALTSFVNRAVGVPFQDRGRSFDGWDCGGLILLAYRECYGLELPDLGEIAGLNRRQMEKLTKVYQASWREIPRGRERPGDVVLLQGGRWSFHLGLVVQPGTMLHVSAELGSTFCESYRTGALQARVVGIYRHEQLAGSH